MAKGNTDSKSNPAKIVKTASYDDHAHKGAELAGNILDELKLTDGTETEQICSMIYHHDDSLCEEFGM